MLYTRQYRVIGFKRTKNKSGKVKTDKNYIECLIKNLDPKLDQSEYTGFVKIPIELYQQSKFIILK